MSYTWLKFAFVSIVSLLCVEPRLLQAAQSSSPCDEGPLPAAVTDLLKKQFPEWRPKQVSDIDADDRQTAVPEEFVSSAMLSPS